MKPVKVVVVGAGSAAFGRGTIADLMACEELNRDAELEVVLVDIDEQALERMYKFGQAVKEYHGATAQLEATTECREALPEADYVITAVSVKRVELWEQDFTVPAGFGFPQVFGETGGPGGAFHTLRSIHLMMPICRDMERLCPEALLINFTNPENRVCLAVKELTTLQAVGLCHGPFLALRKVAEVLGRDEEEIELTVGGINHFYWVLGVKDGETGADLFGTFNQRMQDSPVELQPFVRYLYDKFGLLPYPSQNHPAEFLHFGYPQVGPHLLSWRRHTIQRTPGKYHPMRLAGEIEMTEALEQVATGGAPLTDELAAPDAELAIPIICDIEFDRSRRELSVNVPNEGPAVTNLPEDAIVEVPAMVDAGGIHPIEVGPLPEVIAAMCRLQISIQNLLVEAYRQHSKRLLLQALLLEPTVDNAERAQQLMEELLIREADFLPEFE